METEKRDFYAITGFFVQNHTPNQLVNFGGCFSVSRADIEKRHGFWSSPIDGMLSDCYGRSQISGEMSPAALKFAKVYDGGETFCYYLKREENEIWFGEYANSGTKMGIAFAKVDLQWTGLDTLIQREFDPQRNAEGLPEEVVRGRVIKF
jgi:hypothetical protein